MFWRFGFHNASAIDTLLDKDDVALEAILDEDDLLQECKAQNTRLIDYFQRIDVLRRLLGYVTGEIEGEDRGRFKYPYVATEVLCSEIWSIVESCVNNSEELLSPFWDSVLDRTADDMKTRTVMASQFAKINAVFLNKKPAEMFQFVRSQPRVIERIVAHIETPSFVDLLVRIIQLDEQPGGGDVLEWLSNENLMSRLVDLLSPSRSPDTHNVVSELIKGIILMSAPAPPNGASNDLSPPASNRFARQLVSHENTTKLIAYLFDDFPIDPPREPVETFVDTPLDSSVTPVPQVVLPSSGSSERSMSPTPPALPNIASATSSLIHSISIMIELIRKNNSDYFEPYLFHTLRNRLIHIQQQQQLQREDSREALELAMKEMAERMGVVHLGGLLGSICERLEGFQALLKKPRSMNGPVPTTIGRILPLTFERFRICELYAELLHCSNMSLLNRPPGYGPVYDSEGRLQGGLSALEELAHVIAGSSERESEEPEDDGEGIHEARELPVAGQHPHPPARDYDEDEDDDDDDSISDDDSDDDSGSSRDEEPRAPETRRLGHHSRQASGTDLTPPVTPPALPSSPTPPAMLPASPTTHLASSPNSSRASKTPSPSHTASRKGSMNLRASVSRSNSSIPSTVNEPVGDRLKRRYLELNVASTLLDLFFEFPWNNFLHNVVYDFLHQILSGRVDKGYNRELVISLFRDCRLTTRIVDGQRMNDAEIERPKGVRLGYMGHLTLISEDVVGALEHYPPELLNVLRQFVPQPDWDEYVHGRFRETKTKDTSLLGGGRPILTPGSARPGAGWGKVDEGDVAPGGSATRAVGTSEATASAAGATTGTWRPGSSTQQTADFGSADDDDQGGSVPTQFSQYLAQQLSSVGDSSLSESDDDDDDGEWISRSSTDFPVTGSRPAASASTGFDDSFSSPTRTSNLSFDDAFNPDRDEDDEAGFGPFSDAAATTVFSEIDEDSPFDFGDFQSSEGDGETTPTAGSWTFEDSRSSGSSGHVTTEESEANSEELRTRLEKVSLERDDGVGTSKTKTNPK